MTIIDELAQWIEADLIAEAIFDKLEEQGAQPTLENSKIIWLDALEHQLPQAIASSVKARFDELEAK